MCTCSDRTKYNRLYGQVLYSVGVKQELATGQQTVSVSYRKLLWLLVSDVGDESQLPYDERIRRNDEIQRIQAMMVMSKFVSKLRTRKLQRSLQEYHKQCRMFCDHCKGTGVKSFGTHVPVANDTDLKPRSPIALYNSSIYSSCHP